MCGWAPAGPLRRHIPLPSALPWQRPGPPDLGHAASSQKQHRHRPLVPPVCRPQGLRHRRLTSVPTGSPRSSCQLAPWPPWSFLQEPGATGGAGRGGGGGRQGKHRQGWGCLSQVRADVPRGHRLDSQALTTTTGAGATSVSLREGQARWKECGGQPRAGGAGAPWVQLTA